MASPQILIVQGWRYHERFYFSDGSLHLLIEDSLYRVHRSLFEMYANKSPVCGINASFGNPYALKDVKQIDFDRLLACLYPRTLLVEEAKTSEEWTSILKLASKWGFESLRSRAICELKQTLNTPVDMVAFGRQYDIPDILLSGYTILCQSNVPLTYEEGLHLGMKDVVDIYRIRHQLHGSDTIVSFEDASAKVGAFISNKERKDDGEARTAVERDAYDLDNDQASVWTDVGSVSSSRTPSTGNDRELEAAISMSDIDLPPSEAATTVGVEKLGGSRSEHRSPNAPSSSDASGSQGGHTQLNVSNMQGSTNQVLIEKFLDELTMENFDVVSIKFLQWVNANDNQTIYHVARLIVKKAVKSHWKTDVCIHLCKEIVKKCTVISGNRLFREYLGEPCQKELDDVTVSITAALAGSGETSLDSLPRATRQPKVRRLRLIRFIRELSSEVITSRAIVEKLITPLLNAKDAEKLVTLSMLLDSAGPRWDASTGKLNTFMNNCFVEMTNIAQKTHNGRLRTLLQNVIERRNRGWIVNEAAQQHRCLAEKKRASCSSEDELANEQLEVESDGKRSSERDVVLASSDEKPLDDEKDWFGSGLGWGAVAASAFFNSGTVTGNRLRL